MMSNQNASFGLIFIESESWQGDNNSYKIHFSALPSDLQLENSPLLTSITLLSTFFSNVSNYVQRFHLTMRYAFVLLALLVGTVSGDEIGARIEGFTSDGHYCPSAVVNHLYKKCVVDIAVSLGASFNDRRLELRGSRKLDPCDNCPDAAPFGHWCVVVCGSDPLRRLTIANEHPDGRLPNGQTNQGKIQQAASDCYEEKRGMPQYKCLGTADDLKVFIDYTHQN
jgi:hypothetical protein